jgi:hyperosmotically inducible periplasmic protein
MRASPNGNTANSFWVTWAARDLVLFGALGLFALGQPWGPRLPQSANNTEANPPDEAKEANQTRSAQADADRELARELRKAIVDDKSLSTLAHNIRVDAQNGVVILQGFVRSEEERNTIDSKATEIAGAANVKDELKVKTKE